MLLNSFITNLSLHYIISRMLNINNEYLIKKRPIACLEPQKMDIE